MHAAALRHEGGERASMMNASPPEQSARRQSKATSTPATTAGGDLQYHVHSPSYWHLVFMLGAPVLCFLNGCSYYLFWRSRYLETSASLHVGDTGATLQPLWAASSAYVAPAAHYGVTAGFAFAFVITQWLLQESARTYIVVQSECERATSFRRCGVLFVVAFLPLTVSQMVLMGENYHLHGRRSAVVGVSLMSESDASGLRDVVAISTSHRYVVLWIVTFLLTTLLIVIVASALWADAAVSWLQRRVFAAYVAEKQKTA